MLCLFHIMIKAGSQIYQMSFVSCEECTQMSLIAECVHLAGRELLIFMDI